MSASTAIFRSELARTLYNQAPILVEQYQNGDPDDRGAVCKKIASVALNKMFQQDPQQYMRNWTAKRGNSEEFREVEDPAKEIIEHYLCSR